MASHSQPLGCKALAVFSLLVVIGSISLFINGNIISLFLRILHLAAAYGLWIGIF